MAKKDLKQKDLSKDLKPEQKLFCETYVTSEFFCN
tara:strand:- start:378 stop:482 length:105 start_codon:yes stop_codon:yes gene_type:complete